MERKYANYIEIGYNRHEFVLDFGQLQQGAADPLLHTGIVTSPFHARAILGALQDSLAAFQSAFGEPGGARETDER